MTPAPSKRLGPGVEPIDLLDGCSRAVRRLLHIVHELVDEPHDLVEARTVVTLYATRELGLDAHDVEHACEEIAAHVERVYPSGTVGDAYRTLLRLAQPWHARYPLLDARGAIGDHHDDDPAGPELVSLRPSNLSNTLLPLDRAPMLPLGLLNGAMDDRGLIPSHNLSELWTAMEHLRQDPHEPLDDLMEVLPGPDFPGGGVIWGIGPVRELYETGQALLTVRAAIDEELQGSKTRVSISSLPPGVLVHTVVQEIRDLARRQRFLLTQFEDLSTTEAVRLVVDVSRNLSTADLKALLFSDTSCQRIVPCRLAFETDSESAIRPLREWLAAANARCTPAWRPKKGPVLDRVPTLREIMERGGYESPLFSVVDHRRTKILSG